VGLSVASALLAGLLLAQIGEFSFVIARTALDEGVIEEDLASAFLVAAVLSMVLNPGLVRLGALVIQHARHVPGIRGIILEAADVQQAGEIESLSRHVIVCGYGDSSATLMRSLRGRNLPYVVIDNNPFVFERVRRVEPDLLFIYGDASRPEVLDIARVAHARALAITFPNEIEAQITAFNARSINPRLDIVTRGTRSGHSMLRRAGSSEVVDPEFEAGLEFVRHVLHRFGIDAREITALQAQRRAEHYRAE
jgi:CPA2 family monovalent cation:H+ antiporter-2